jgi:hypothetical protein
MKCLLSDFDQFKRVALAVYFVIRVMFLNNITKLSVENIFIVEILNYSFKHSEVVSWPWP